MMNVRYAWGWMVFVWMCTGVDARWGADNGFGAEYKWEEGLESGLETIRHSRKPGMVLIHKTWCGACKSLKPKFAESKEILYLSRYFIMINLMDDQEPSDPEYSPDGSYIPRLLFISPEGNVLPEIYNEQGSAQHKYFYSQPDLILTSMKKVLEKYEVKPVKIIVNVNDEL